MTFLRKAIHDSYIGGPTIIFYLIHVYKFSIIQGEGWEVFHELSIKAILLKLLHIYVLQCTALSGSYESLESRGYGGRSKERGLRKKLLSL